MKSMFCLHCMESHPIQTAKAVFDSQEQSTMGPILGETVSCLEELEELPFAPCEAVQVILPGISEYSEDSYYFWHEAKDTISLFGCTNLRFNRRLRMFKIIGD